MAIEEQVIIVGQPYEFELPAVRDRTGTPPINYYLPEEDELPEGILFDPDTRMLFGLSESDDGGRQASLYLIGPRTRSTRRDGPRKRCR